jgi:tetratricopeptide (TPR) repeat protein
LNSISAYRSFINQYKGQNNIKDAHYKIGLSYWLNGNQNDAHSAFQVARAMGKEVTEGDKHAARSLAEDELPHPELTKARYATDGGYYKKAAAMLDSISPPELLTRRDKIEFSYRRARLAHRLGKLSDAKTFYKKVIDGNGDATWYFAPNSSLQMGYILMEEGRKEEAEEFFEMALSYKKHEYKNSIDTKARSGLAQLGVK